MALTSTQQQDIIKYLVGLFNAAPGGYMAEMSQFVVDGGSPTQMALNLADGPVFKGLTFAYSDASTNEQFVDAFFANLLGDTVSGDALAWATDWALTRIEQAGRGTMMVEAIDTLAAVEDDNTDWVAARDQQAARIEAATEYTITNNGTSTDLDELQAVVAGSAPVDTGDVLTLTVRADNLTGDAGDNVFTAPVLQNETGSGQLANTFETGDVLAGGAGFDVLRADLIDSGSVSDVSIAPAISAETSGIEAVYLRAQTPQNDGTVNVSTIDAEKMAGVEQWWTDNSRSNIQIEDIRTDTAATTFGMRQTDPTVGFNAYFNVLSLEGDVTATSAMTLNIYEGPLGAPNATTQLENITVREISFTVEGEQITLDTEAIRAADTWAELEAALNEALDAIEGADTVTLINRGNGQFVFEDSAGREFQVNDGEALVLSVTNNITVTNSLTVGRDEVTGPIISSAVLDGAGNGSQGGALNIGAMSGLKGIEELSVDVDRDSHLTSITSFNLIPGQYANLRNGEPNEFLEVVELTSIGAEGDLTVGRTTANLDARVATWSNAGGLVNGVADSGFVNIRELNTESFNGALNVAVTLDDNAIGRYLDPATEPVIFSYDGGAQNDIFNIADVSTLGSVSSDQDFAMEVDMGAGDDRLILNVPTVSAVSVDGGEGENSIVVAQSHGTNAANTFGDFANFQTYEIEGTGNNVVNNTVHDFTSMTGIENVIIATDGNTAVGGVPTVGDNTQLIDLEAAQNVTISGRTQTIGNNSTNDQIFGTVRLTNDDGTDRTITLENTARLSNLVNTVRQDGVLTVTALTIDETATGSSATTDLTIASTGARNVANVVAALDAQDVETLNLVGTQDLTINVVEIANQAAAAGVTASTALDIDASDLEGELNLAIDGAMIGNWGTATGLTDRIVGTEGDSDTLLLWGAQGNDPVTVTGFETVQFGNAFGSMFGDLDITAAGGLAIDATGIYDAQNTGVTNYVIADDLARDTALTLNNLASGVTVVMGDANRDAAGAVVNSQIMDDTITLNSGAVAGTPDAVVTVNYLSNIVGGSAHILNIGNAILGTAGDDTDGFQAININVAHAANLTGLGLASDIRTMALTLTEDSRTLNLTGGFDNNDGGVVRDTMTFTANLPNALTRVDLSGYEGDVTLTMQQGIFVGVDALAQTDVRFVMSEDDANITLSNMDGTLGAATGVQHNSVFEFTGAKSTADYSEWTITNFVGAGQAGASMDNITRFDVSDLGITSFDQISIDIATDALGGALAAGTFAIRSEAQDDASALTGVNQNTWEIQVTGLVALVAAGDITADNFIFA